MDLKNELSSRIKQAASAFGVPPYELAYNQLQRFLKDIGDSWLSENSHKMRVMGGYTDLRDAMFQRLVVSPNDLPMEAAKVRAAAAAGRKDVKLAVRDRMFWQSLEKFSDRYAGKIVPKGFAAKPKPKKNEITREINVLLSDLHFGSDLDPRYVPLKYGVVEEARRLAHVVKQVCEYKRDHRNETRLRVHLAGDIIQGQLHDKRDGDISSAQQCRAIHLLSQAIGVFACEFKEVIVDCSTGNHDRNTARHTDRATLDKVDSAATVIYYAVKKSAQNLKNVTIDITRKPYITYESFGAKCFGTHGDTVLNPGYPGSVINAKNLEHQINRINASLPNAEEYKLFFVGHVHVGTIIHMNNGAVLITNGALIPTDQYAISIGLFENSCGQWLWESVPGHVVGDSRFITVNEDVDANESLDRVIEPFEDF